MKQKSDDYFNILTLVTFAIGTSRILELKFSCTYFSVGQL